MPRAMNTAVDPGRREEGRGGGGGGGRGGREV